MIYGFARRRETRETERRQRARWKKRKKDAILGREEEGWGGEGHRRWKRARVHVRSTRARECKHTVPRAGRWKWATGEVKAGRWRRSLQFSARRPLDRSNANNVADANCR